MSLTTAIRSALSHIATANSDLAVTVRYSGTDEAMAGTITGALSSGLDRVRTATEEGLIDTADGYIRYRDAVEPAAWAVNDAIQGQVVEVLRSGETAWLRCRVIGRKKAVGVVKLNVTAEFAEA